MTSPFTVEMLEDVVRRIGEEGRRSQIAAHAESDRRMAMVPSNLWTSDDISEEERTLVAAWVDSPDAVMHPNQARRLGGMLEAIFAKVGNGT